MQKKKTILLILLVLVALLILTYFLFVRVARNNQSGEFQDVTKIDYSLGKTGCLNISSKTPGTKASISSLDNSFQKIVDLPVRECVPIGEVMISIYAGEYKTYQVDVEVKKDEEQTISADLKYVGNSEDPEDTSSIDGFTY